MNFTFDIVKGMNYFWRIIKLDKKGMEHVAHDHSLNGIAGAFLLGGSFVVALCFYIFGATTFMVNFKPDLGLAFISWIVLIVTCFLEILAASVIALKLFMAKGNFGQFFRVAGIASLFKAFLAIGFIFPLLGSLVQAAVALWSLVVGFVALKTIFKLDTGNTILTMVLTVFVMVFLNLAAGYLGFANLGNMAMNQPLNVNITY